MSHPVHSRLVGGPACGTVVALLAFVPCVEFLRTPDGATVYIGMNGKFAPNNTEVWFDRYVFRKKTRCWEYIGRFDKSYYEEES